MKTQVLFVHTAAAAMGPVVEHYGREAPELEIVNVLDDGLLRMLGRKETDNVEQQLRALVAASVKTYAPKAALVTCSSVPQAMTERLEAELSLPVVKIDGPMAALAAQAGGMVGVAATFAGTVGPTTRLIEQAAQAAGRTVQVQVKLMEEAYRALFAGRGEEHDRIVVEGVRELAAAGVDAVVLAQVSMARVRTVLPADIGVPVYNSLETSLSALRQRLPG